MEVFGFLEMRFEVGDEAAGQHGDAVFHAFAVANDDLLLGEVEVFDSEGKCFAHAHSGAVKELDEKAVGAIHLGDDGANFLGGEDSGEIARLSGTNGVDIGEFYF